MEHNNVAPSASADGFKPDLNIQCDDDDDSGGYIHEPQVIIDEPQTTDDVWVKQEPAEAYDERHGEEEAQGSYNDPPRTSIANFPESSGSGWSIDTDQSQMRRASMWKISKRDKTDVCVKAADNLNECPLIADKTHVRHGAKQYKCGGICTKALKLPCVGKCGMCAYSSANAGHLRAHIITHSEARPFKCKECAYVSSCASNLKKHMHTHSGLRPYKCVLCAYSCGESSCLKRHIVTTHSETRPYKCEECAFTSSRADNMRRHSATHTGDKRFGCAYAGCAYKFVSAGDLRKHVATHTGHKGYRCTLCPYSSIQAGPLKAHMAQHTGLKPFACPHCDYKTADKSNLTKHVQLMHTVEKNFRCSHCTFSCAAKLTFTRHMRSKHSDRPLKVTEQTRNSFQIR